MAEFETDGSSALAPKDPYRGMDSPETRPNLRVIEGGKSKSDGAKDNLAGAEKNAVANPLSVIEGGAGAAKSAEQNQAFGPRFTGKGLPGVGKDDKSKKKGVLSGKGPLIAIMALLMGGGGMMVGSQMMMPFATANRIIQEFNSMKTIMSRRSDRILRFQLDTERYKSPTRTTIFGRDRFKVSTKQAAKLRIEGIEYMQLGDGRRVLVFDDGSGRKQPIVSNSDAARLPNGGDLDATTIDNIRANLRTDLGGGDIDISSRAISIDAAMEIDGFKFGYMKSSKTWKGNIAGWFDSLVLKVFDRLGISRSRFSKWKNASDIEAGNAAFKEAANNRNRLSDSDSDVVALRENEVKQPDGSTKPETGEVRVEGDPDSVLGAEKTEAQVKDGLTAKIGKVAQAAGSAACAVFAAAGAIHAIVAAQQALEILNLVTGYLEAVQKVQAGDGDGSPMAYYTNALTTADKDGNSGMSASGMGALFGSGSVDINDESVKNTNSESLMSNVKIAGAELTYSIQDFEKCAYARIIGNTVGAIIDIVGLATGGIATLVKGLVVSIANAAWIGAVTTMLVSFVVPAAARMIMKNYINDFVGEDLGNAIASGANKYLGGNHQGGGGSPGDTQTVLAYKRATSEILAEEAEYDRRNRSPFDVTSQNTFFGSLLYSMAPLSSSLTSMSSVLSGFSNLIASSTTSLLSTASAIAETELITTKGDCPLLESVGIMGDAYCNPYYTTDLTTIETDPGEEVYESVASMRVASSKKTYTHSLKDDAGQCVSRRDVNGSPIEWSYGYYTNFKYDESSKEHPGCILDVTLNEEANPVINANSALGEYIVFCGQRSSAWGVADGAITSQITNLDIDTGVGMMDGILNGVSGAIPILGDLYDVAQAAEELINIPWIGGSACVASESNDLWGENKYYQRYVEDQRLMESSGIITESTVTAVLDEYYEANPLDNSYEGILARFSGMLKDDVIATLDLIDYASFVAEYEPSGLAPMAVAKEEVSLAEQVPDGVIANPSDMPIVHHIVYTDIRSKSYAV